MFLNNIFLKVKIFIFIGKLKKNSNFVLYYIKIETS